MAAMMWMRMGSASVGRGGTCTDMTVNTLYLQGGEGGVSVAQREQRTTAQGQRTHGANKNSSSPSTLLPLTKFTCLHLFIRLCCPAGSK